MKVEVDFASIPAGDRSGIDLVRYIFEFARYRMKGDEQVVISRRDLPALEKHIHEANYVPAGTVVEDLRIFGLPILVGPGEELPYLVKRVPLEEPG